MNEVGFEVQVKVPAHFSLSFQQCNLSLIEVFPWLMGIARLMKIG